MTVINSDVPTTFYVYIVRCADDTLYTGKTNNLLRRIRQHNGEILNGAKYTRARRPVSLVFYEEYVTNALADKREREIKLLSRTEKNNLIYRQNLELHNKKMSNKKVINYFAYGSVAEAEKRGPAKNG